MKRRKRIDFKSGDIFTVPLMDNRFTLGQVLDQRWPNVVRIALFDKTIDRLQEIDITEFCKSDNLISLVEVTKEQLAFGAWKIVGNKEVNIPISKYPNEQFRNNQWIGSITYDAALAEDFLNAFYALIPWDDWYDPHFLEKLLIDISKKPQNLILIKTD